MMMALNTYRELLDHDMAKAVHGLRSPVEVMEDIFGRGFTQWKVDEAVRSRTEFCECCGCAKCLTPTDQSLEYGCSSLFDREPDELCDADPYRRRAAFYQATDLVREITFEAGKEMLV